MQLFFDLLQISLGHKEVLSQNPSQEEWYSLFLLSQKQACSGFAFEALDKLSANGQKVPADLLFEWIALSEQIKQRNILLNRKAVELTNLFKNDGFRSCILKGQGNAELYPNPLSRSAGDIDIWLEGDKDTIISYIRNKFPTSKDNGIHLEYPIYEDVEVEVHYKPQYMACKKYDHRLEEFFHEEAPKQFEHKVKLTGMSDEVSVPLPYFNLIQQLSHLLGHFYGSGIGYRHLIDLYYVLKNIPREQRDCDAILSYFGLLSFAEGVMWVENKILGLDDSYLVAVPSEKKGRLILQEIERGGNFGMYNQRNKLRSKGIVIRAFLDMYRLYQLLSIQPSEACKRMQWKISNTKSMKKAIGINK